MKTGHSLRARLILMTLLTKKAHVQNYYKWLVSDIIPQRAVRRWVSCRAGQDVNIHSLSTESYFISLQIGKDKILLDEIQKLERMNILIATKPLLKRMRSNQSKGELDITKIVLILTDEGRTYLEKNITLQKKVENEKVSLENFENPKTKQKRIKLF